MQVMNYRLFYFLFLFSSVTVQFGQSKFDSELLNDSKKNGPVISQQLASIEVPKYSDTLRKCIYLVNGFRSAKFINEKDWNDIKDTVIPYRIDVVYSKYPLRNGVYVEIYPLLFNRLKALFEMDPSLNDPAIQWNKIMQTNCINDEQVNKLFHGVVIWYKTNEHEEISKVETELTGKYEVIRKEQEILTSEQNSIEELTQSVENIKSYSYIPDSLKKQLETQSLDAQIKTIRKFLEKSIKDEPEVVLNKSSADELKFYSKEVNEFLKRYPARDSVVSAVLNRHPEWRNVLVINDWTGSMYGYGAQVLSWHLKHFERSGILSLTLFNDGDDKKDADKRIGETEGIYYEKADNILKLVKLFNYIMLKGGGGDGPENDIEAILKAMEVYPYYSEIILIADNNACIRDIELADRIGKPVKVIVCGFQNKTINPDLVYLAKITGGGIYTIESDIENINATLGSKGEVNLLDDPRLKIKSKRCNDASISDKEIHDYAFAKRHKRRVRRLTLAGKELKELPNRIYRMHRLNYLDLSHNSLSEISPKIKDLETLSEVNFSFNNFSKLPVELRSVHFIQKLDLSHNVFSSIPSPILAMKFLTQLDVSHNSLTALEKNMTMRKLEKFNLSNNDIEEIPKAIGQLKSLRVLNLSFNKIYSIHDNITALNRLIELNLSNNKLAKLPEHLEKLRSLKKLNLEGNNFSSEEKERIRKRLPNAEILF